MAGAHAAEPIKLGVLMDYVMPDSDVRDDFVQPLELVFKEGLESGMIDRPVELVHREVDGLPRGTVKAVIDAFGELVDVGLRRRGGAEHQRQRRRRPRGDRAAVPGPGDQRLRLRGLARRVDVPPQQRLHDRRADPVGPPDGEGRAEDGGHAGGALVHRTDVPAHFRRAAQDAGIQIVAEEYIAQTGQDIAAAVRTLHDSRAEAIVHCGFGWAWRRSTTRSAHSTGTRPGTWGPPWRPASTHGSGTHSWDGSASEQYDEGNPVAKEFLDRFEAAYGRRPEYFNPVLWRDVATSFLHALADATPLSPRGVRDALERVKMLPAACGSAGTRISFGRWSHRGWMGAGYLVARTLDPNGKAQGKLWKSTLVGRYGQDLTSRRVRLDDDVVLAHLSAQRRVAAGRACRSTRDRSRARRSERHRDCRTSASGSVKPWTAAPKIVIW